MWTRVLAELCSVSCTSKPAPRPIRKSYLTLCPSYDILHQISFVTKTIVWGSIFLIFFLGIAIAGFAKYQAGVWEYEVPQVV